MKWVIRGTTTTHEVDVERRGDVYQVTVNGTRHPVDLMCLDGAVASLRYIEDGRSFQVSFQSANRHSWRVAVGEREFDFSVLTPVEAIEKVAAATGLGPGRIDAPIPGKVVAVNVVPGDDVEAGQTLVVLEAMKMENELTVEHPGKVAAVHVEPGDTVDSGTLLVEFE